MENRIAQQQKDLCSRYNSPFVDSPLSFKVGISLDVKSGLLPINGLRHKPEGDTTGWYIWAGEEFSDEPGFFVPLHVEHLIQWCPVILPYLGLAPGWRFLIADAYEDVWADDSLLLT